jgi:hypothetical protein
MMSLFSFTCSVGNTTVPYVEHSDDRPNSTERLAGAIDVDSNRVIENWTIN